MDVFLEYCDIYFFDRFWSTILPLRVPMKSSSYPSNSFNSSIGPSHQVWSTVSAWPRDDVRRQIGSLLILVQIGIFILYFGIAGLSYRFIYDHRMMQHPRFLKGQVRMEIMTSIKAFPWLNLMTLPWFLGEVRGWSLLYHSVDSGPLGGGKVGIAYMVFTAAFFLWFTDLAIYWVHRWLHLPSLYKHLHKPHHKWIIPTPFASHAFHPVDGYLQSLPYHICAYIIPVHKFLYAGLFVFVNIWSIFIHDSDMIVDHPLERIVNGPAHHTLHHLYFTCNYGQYFTWSDRLGGSYRHPSKGDDPLLVILENQKSKGKAD